MSNEPNGTSLAVLVLGKQLEERTRHFHTFTEADV